MVDKLESVLNPAKAQRETEQICLKDVSGHQVVKAWFGRMGCCAIVGLRAQETGCCPQN